MNKKWDGKNLESLIDLPLAGHLKDKSIEILKKEKYNVFRIC